MKKMFQNRIWAFLILLNSPQCWCLTENFMASIYPENHTCLAAIKPTCDDFKLIQHSKEQEELYLMAHNRIRSLAAERFEIADMLRVYWDPQLQTMSENSLALCSKGVKPKNKCDDKVYQLYTYKEVKFNYLHNVYDTTLFTEWYAEVPVAVPLIARYLVKDLSYFFFNATNNFTGIINPSTYRIGCAVGTYDRAFAVMCTYLIDQGRRGLFRIGQPGSLCENQFPGQSSAFDGLCAPDNAAFLQSTKMLWISTIILNVFFYNSLIK